jgi:ubiquitin C-terminal hydrolase
MPLKGLFNRGVSCYANAVLQCLIQFPGLIQPILKLMAGSRLSGGDWFSRFHHFITAYISSKDSFRPNMIVDHLESMFSPFMNKKDSQGQQDAHEFLRILLEGIDSSFPKRAKGRLGGHTENTASTVNQVFGGSLTSTTQCKCGYENTVQDPMRDLSLSIEASNINSVTEALASLSAQEALDDGYTCEVCKKTGGASRVLEVHTAPDVCIIHLKRFAAATDTAGRENAKNDKFIEFDDKLTLPCKGPEGPASYSLKCVVVHDGPTIRRGHYFSYVRNTKGEWSRLNDGNVTTRVSPSEVFRQRAYMLFYAKVTLGDSYKNLSPHKTLKPIVFRQGRGIKKSASGEMGKARSGDTNKQLRTPKNTPTKASGKRHSGPVGGALLDAVIQNFKMTYSAENNEGRPSEPDEEPMNLDPDKSTAKVSSPKSRAS